MHVLHREEVAVADAPDVVDLRDVRMVELRYRLAGFLPLGRHYRCRSFPHLADFDFLPLQGKDPRSETRGNLQQDEVQRSLHDFRQEQTLAHGRHRDAALLHLRIPVDGIGT